MCGFTASSLIARAEKDDHAMIFAQLPGDLETDSFVGASDQRHRLR